MKPQRHIVRRVVLEFNVGPTELSPQEARQEQTRLSALCRERLPALLDRTLSELAEPSVLYQIERLECDISGIAPERLEADWAEKVEPKLREALRQAVRKAMPQRFAAAAHPEKKRSSSKGENLASGSLTDDWAIPKQSVLPNLAPLAPQPETALRLLQHFLETGHLPWWAVAADRDIIARSLYVLIENPAYLAPLLASIQSDTTARHRLLRHTNVVGRLALAAAAGPGFAAFFSDLEDLTTFGKVSNLRVSDNLLPQPFPEGDPSLVSSSEISSEKTASTDETNDPLAATSGPVLTQKTPGAGTGETPHNPDSNQGLQKKQRAGEGPDFLGNDPPMSASGPVSTQKTPDAGREETSSDSVSNRVSDKAQRGSKSQIFLETGPSAATAAKFLPPTIAQEKTRGFDDSDTIYLQNAGLVLLGPFLSRFFENLGWAEKGRFTGWEAQHLAIAALQFLADGQTEPPPEHLLVLPKILCGLAPSSLFDPPRPLSEPEMAEAENLLAAVLEQAPMLGLRTVNALRGSFLLRAGALRPRGDHWALHVEAETFDLLLGRLPWGFRALRLPWMEAAVLVNWEI